MATRLYFSGLTAAPVTASANAAWGDTSEAVQRYLAVGKTGTPLADGTRVGPWAVGPTSAKDRTFVGPEFTSSGTTGGTVKCQIRAREYAAGDNVTSNIEIYIVAGDGSTVRGTVLARGDYGGGAELNTTNRNKTFAVSGTACSSVAYNAGDRPVVVLGFIDQAAAVSPEGSCAYGDPVTGTDLPEDETTTTAGVGWIEFSQDWAFNAVNTPTRLAGAVDDTDQATVTLNATGGGTTINVTAGQVLCLGAGSWRSGSPTPNPTIGGTLGGTLTWTQRVNVSDIGPVGSEQTNRAWTAVVPSNASGTITLAFGAAVGGCAYALDAFTGDVAGGIDTTAPVVQSKSASTGTGDGTSLNATFDSTPTAGNCLWSSWTAWNSSSTLSPRSGHGQLTSVGSSDFGRFISCWRQIADTETAVGVVDSTTDHLGGGGVELKRYVASVGGGGSAGIGLLLRFVG